MNCHLSTVDCFIHTKDSFVPLEGSERE
uniref:Uncharacterized protein n=1 Tax=Anguilla anguilla TaxID=7936 RepID=A0A0E9T3Z6_ANGAN